MRDRRRRERQERKTFRPALVAVELQSREPQRGGTKMRLNRHDRDATRCQLVGGLPPRQFGIWLRDWPNRPRLRAGNAENPVRTFMAKGNEHGFG